MIDFVTRSQIEGRDLLYDLAVSPDFANNGVCFAARSSGLYQSHDAGQTWRALYETMSLGKPLLTTAVVVSPEFARDQLLLAGAKGGIVRTDNEGITWRAMLFPSPVPLITTMAASPTFADDGLVLAGTAEDGVFCSNDGGLHWEARNFGLLDLSISSIAFSRHFGDDQTVLLGTDSGIFRSSNGGRSWRTLPFPAESAPVTALAIGEAGIFAGTQSNGLYLSGDEGGSWERLDAGLIPGMVNAVRLGFPNDRDITALLDTRLVTSSDGGRTWQVYAELGEPALLLAASTAARAALVGTVEGRVLRVFDGAVIDS